MAFPHKMEKQIWFPRPHAEQVSWTHSLESAVVNQAVIMPILMYDEGQGAPSSYKANPENAAFALAVGPNCFPESKVDRIFSQLRISLTKGAIETDKIVALRFGIMPIMMAFLENYTAKDEKSTLAVEDIIEMQTESTDRQGYPLWNNVKTVEKFANSDFLNAAVPGLTTDQGIEAVAFSPNTFYNSIKYYTIANKIKASIGGMKWFTMTPHNPVRTFNLKIKRKVKSMNPYTFYGVMVYLPSVGGHYQYMVTGETTAIPHLYVDYQDNFFEWNRGFDMEKV